MRSRTVATTGARRTWMALNAASAATSFRRIARRTVAIDSPSCPDWLSPASKRPSIRAMRREDSSSPFGSASWGSFHASVARPVRPRADSSMLR